MKVRRERPVTEFLRWAWGQLTSMRTALALLFAIFTARPSPFYVMDEVEAALDDVNLTRLINAFNELREHAQLIIITHQQRTMSIADALYGVSMRQDGISAVVGQRIGGEEG